MSGWYRYPNRLAHVARNPTPLLSGDQRIGTSLWTLCGKTLNVYWDARSWQATYVDPLELRAEKPRGWCLRCCYWTALFALILPGRGFDAFVAAVYRGDYP